MDSVEVLSFYKTKNETQYQTGFIDFLRFMASSLDRFSEYLAKCECKINYNCIRNNFKYTSDVFQNTEKVEEIIKKGIYPYEYIDSCENIYDTNRQVLSKITREKYF